MCFTVLSPAPAPHTTSTSAQGHRALPAPFSTRLGIVEPVEDNRVLPSTWARAVINPAGEPRASAPRARSHPSSSTSKTRAPGDPPITLPSTRDSMFKASAPRSAKFGGKQSSRFSTTSKTTRPPRRWLGSNARPERRQHNSDHRGERRNGPRFNALVQAVHPALVGRKLQRECQVHPNASSVSLPNLRALQIDSNKPLTCAYRALPEPDRSLPRISHSSLAELRLYRGDRRPRKRSFLLSTCPGVQYFLTLGASRKPISGST